MILRLTACASLLSMGAFAAPGVSFHKDIEPILQSRCQECHRSGEIGPMPLMTYQQVRPWAKAMRASVVEGKMPPWPINPHYGKFENDRSLSKQQIDLFTAWVDNGAPEGNPADAPSPRKWTDGWNIPTPDAVLETPSFDMPASGRVEYQYIVVPTGFKEDKWIQMAEIRPGDRTIVHHAQIFIREPGSKWLADVKPGVPFSFELSPSANQRLVNGSSMGTEILTIYTPGMVPDVWKPGTAKLIPAGSDLVFQMHYTASGKPARDRTRLGLVFSKDPPKERVFTMLGVNTQISIPPGDPNYKAETIIPITHDMTMLTLFPHMHLRGKAFQHELIYPNGESETLLKVDKWSLSWQLSYKLQKPIALKPGMKIKATGWWDNSANNPANPDAASNVTWGEQSWEEMLVGFFDVAVDPKVAPRTVHSTRGSE
jgi:hypothetical protein